MRTVEDSRDRIYLKFEQDCPCGPCGLLLWMSSAADTEDRCSWIITSVPIAQGPRADFKGRSQKEAKSIGTLS